MSSSRSRTDEKMLFENLHKAIENDKLYWIRNEAKIRACTTSKNYDEFREIVDAAHLRPVRREDKEKKARIGWNKAFKEQE